MNEKPVTFCPYCGKTKIVEISQWAAESAEDKENKAELIEYQCFDCYNRSFWA